jgi:hypothetical protein
MGELFGAPRVTRHRARRPFGNAHASGQLMKGSNMLYTLAVILLVLWLLGLVSSVTMGGFIHILLVVAVVMILVNLISGRRAL